METANKKFKITEEINLILDFNPSVGGFIRFKFDTLVIKCICSQGDYVCPIYASLFGQHACKISNLPTNCARWRVSSKKDISRVIANEYNWMIQDMSKYGK